MTSSVNPLVSVILPTYNRAQLLGRAMESVLSQTFLDFELIVVDDASSDDTRQVVAQFKDRRVRCFEHHKNQGAAAARNTGIQASRGALIAFQDSDDEWLPEKLEEQVAAFSEWRRPGMPLGVVYCRFLRRKRGLQTVFPPLEVSDLQGDVRASLLEGNFISTQAALVKKECFEVAGLFDLSLPCLLDWELWLRISRYFAFKLIPQPLVIVNSSADSISVKPIRLAQAYARIHSVHVGTLGNRRLDASFFYRTGNLFCLAGEIRTGRGYLLKASRNSPMRLRSWAALLASFGGSKFYRLLYRIKQAIQPDWY